MNDLPPSLVELAHHYGVATQYQDWTGRDVTAAESTLVAVLDALRSGDPDRAEAAVRRHIEEPGEWIRSAHQQEQAARTPEADEKQAAI